MKEKPFIIDVATVLSADLKSRSIVADLLLFAKNSGEKNILLDFSNVKFATRSVIDEMYNVFIKNSSTLSFDVSLSNVPEDINTIFQVVSRTQVNTSTVRAASKVTHFNTMDQIMDYFKNAVVN